MAEKSNGYLKNLLATRICAQSIDDSEEKKQLLLIYDKINERCKSNEFDAPITLGIKAHPYVEKINESLKLRGFELKLTKNSSIVWFKLASQIFQKALQDSTLKEIIKLLHTTEAIAKLCEIDVFNGGENKHLIFEYRLQILPIEKEEN